MKDKANDFFNSVFDIGGKIIDKVDKTAEKCIKKVEETEICKNIGESLSEVGEAVFSGLEKLFKKEEDN